MSDPFNIVLHRTGPLLNVDAQRIGTKAGIEAAKRMRKMEKMGYAIEFQYKGDFDAVCKWINESRKGVVLCTTSHAKEYCEERESARHNAARCLDALAFAEIK